MDDAAPRAAAADRGEIEPRLQGHAPGEGGGFDLGMNFRRSRDGDRRGGVRFTFGRRGRMSVGTDRSDGLRGGRLLDDGGARGAHLVQDRQDRTDLDLLRASRRHDLEQTAGRGGFQVHRRLVGLDLGDDLAGLYGIALTLPPGDDGALGHRVDEARHADLGGHGWGPGGGEGRLRGSLRHTSASGIQGSLAPHPDPPPQGGRELMLPLPQSKACDHIHIPSPLVGEGRVGGSCSARQIDSRTTSRSLSTS